jgi:hypothetical protein
MGPAWDLHTDSFLLDDEIRAAFEICRKRGFKVMAHATNPEAVKSAIRLGAHRSNPNDWLRTRLVAPEFHCGVPR